MPRRKRTSRQGRLSRRQRGDLLMHHGYLVGPGRPFASEEQRRAAWELHRDELLAATNPGTYPAAYWTYDHPGEKREGEDPRPWLGKE
jgi:hypothetical protein